MRAIVIVTVVLLIAGLGFIFLYSHSLSIDRARLISSINDLLVAQKQLQQHGSLTNQGQVYIFTNSVTVEGAVFQCTLAAESPYLADYGLLAVATDGTLIWIDKKTGPVVVRNADRQFSMPQRFKRGWL